MVAWPRLLASHPVRAGRADGSVIRCGLADLMLADLPVAVVFFFDRPLDPAQLIGGLATALGCAPAFAGRLREDELALEIVCEDAGVPLTVYDLDDTLEQAVGRVTMPGSDLVDLVDANGARSGGGPLLTVRISRLAGGATALGCSWHHAVGDMQSFMVLMRAWSAAVAGAEPVRAVQVPDRDAYLDSVLPAEDRGRPSLRRVGPEEAAGIEREVAGALRANRTVQIYFTDVEVDRLREEFGAETGLKLTANDVLCAHVVGAIRTLDRDRAERTLTIPVNIRRAMGIAPETIGNLVGDINLTAPAGRPAPQVAADIRGAVERFAHEHLCLRANRAFLGDLGRDRIGECFPLGFDPVRRTFTVSNWSRFGLYDLDFAGHRPVLMSPAADLLLPWVASVVEGFHGAGILCTVTVPAAIAARLRGAAGREILHPYRSPDEPLPALAAAIRKLA
ncbi:MAG TPA: acyltransferase [Actinocrinis sp.]|nr:acyltransferase [Actinocrinis sp.]